MSSCASSSASRERRRVKKHDKPKLWIFPSFYFLFSLRHSHSQIYFHLPSPWTRIKNAKWRRRFSRQIKLHRFLSITEVFCYFLLKTTFSFIEENRSPLELYVHTLGRLNENWKILLAHFELFSPAERKHFRHFLFSALRENVYHRVCGKFEFVRQHFHDTRLRDSLLMINHSEWSFYDIISRVSQNISNLVSSFKCHFIARELLTHIADTFGEDFPVCACLRPRGTYFKRNPETHS